MILLEDSNGGIIEKVVLAITVSDACPGRVRGDTGLRTEASVVSHLSYPQSCARNRHSRGKTKIHWLSPGLPFEVLFAVLYLFRNFTLFVRDRFMAESSAKASTVFVPGNNANGCVTQLVHLFVVTARLQPLELNWYQTLATSTLSEALPAAAMIASVTVAFTAGYFTTLTGLRISLKVAVTLRLEDIVNVNVAFVVSQLPVQPEKPQPAAALARSDSVFPIGRSLLP
jgi:hypothetical protein